MTLVGADLLALRQIGSLTCSRSASDTSVFNSGPSSTAGRSAYPCGSGRELSASVRAQPHNVFPDGSLLRGHESPPWLACRGSDSENRAKFNDVSN
jgi:hypothetical protein